MAQSLHAISQELGPFTKFSAYPWREYDTVIGILSHGYEEYPKYVIPKVGGALNGHPKENINMTAIPFLSLTTWVISGKTWPVFSHDQLKETQLYRMLCFQLVLESQDLPLSQAYLSNIFHVIKWHKSNEMVTRENKVLSEFVFDNTVRIKSRTKPHSRGTSNLCWTRVSTRTVQTRDENRPKALGWLLPRLQDPGLSETGSECKTLLRFQKAIMAPANSPPELISNFYKTIADFVANNFAPNMHYPIGNLQSLQEATRIIFTLQLNVLTCGYLQLV